MEILRAFGKRIDAFRRSPGHRNRVRRRTLNQGQIADSGRCPRRHPVQIEHHDCAIHGGNHTFVAAQSSRQRPAGRQDETAGRADRDIVGNRAGMNLEIAGGDHIVGNDSVPDLKRGFPQHLRGTARDRNERSTRNPCVPSYGEPQICTGGNGNTQCHGTGGNEERAPGRNRNIGRNAVLDAHAAAEIDDGILHDAVFYRHFAAGGNHGGNDQTGGGDLQTVIQDQPDRRAAGCDPHAAAGRNDRGNRIGAGGQPHAAARKDRDAVRQTAGTDLEKAAVPDDGAVGDCIGHDVHFAGGIERNGAHCVRMGKKLIVRTVINAGIPARERHVGSVVDQHLSFARSPDNSRRRPAGGNDEPSAAVDGDPVCRTIGHDVHFAGGIERNVAHCGLMSKKLIARTAVDAGIPARERRFGSVLDQHPPFARSPGNVFRGTAGKHMQITVGLDFHLDGGRPGMDRRGRAGKSQFRETVGCECDLRTGPGIHISAVFPGLQCAAAGGNDKDSAGIDLGVEVHFAGQNGCRASVHDEPVGRIRRRNGRFADLQGQHGIREIELIGDAGNGNGSPDRKSAEFFHARIHDPDRLTEIPRAFGKDVDAFRLVHTDRNGVVRIAADNGKILEPGRRSGQSPRQVEIDDAALRGGNNSALPDDSPGQGSP